MLNKRILVLVSLLLVSFLLVGCGVITPITNHPPVITLISNQIVTVGVTFTYDVEATDQDFDALTYSLIRNPSGMKINEHTGVITWEEPTVGSHGITVKVSDGVLYATESFTVTVTPVAELTEIVVDPDTMVLEVGETGTFTVTASDSFGGSQDVTINCDYDLLTTGVITVTLDSVTAVGIGTDTIFISYTKGNITVTATITVTVREPMEIIVDSPLTFRVGEPYWFMIEMTANDDVGKLVVAHFGWPKSSETGVKIEGTLDTEVGSDLPFVLEKDDVFQTDPFTMRDATVNFRGTFTSPGTYGTTIEVETTGGISLCSQGITILVEGDLAVGDSYGGGIVAYILQSGDSGYDENIQHGLIAATEDATSIMQWSDAVSYCDTLVEGGYDDWFLPSIDELDKLYDNRGIIGGFKVAHYWSSSEVLETDKAYYISFDSGSAFSDLKSETKQVRAVRVF